jgi:hypothetical protein
MVSTENIDVCEFSFSTLPETGFYEVLGKRGTGKTTWTKYILQFSKYAKTGMFIVMCGSETIKETWSDIVHPMYIQDASVQYLESLKNDRNNLMRKKKKKDLLESDHVTLILDDVASNKKIMKSAILTYLACNSRHLHMSIFILAQYHCQLSTEVRNQNDFIFMLATSDRKSIKRIYEEYASCANERIFRALLTFCTSDHGLFVVNNQISGNNITKICSTAKITNYNDLEFERLGAPKMLEFADSMYIDVDTVIPSVEDAQEWFHYKSEHDNDNTIIDTLSDGTLSRVDLTKKMRNSRKIFTDRQGKIIIRKV